MELGKKGMSAIEENAKVEKQVNITLSRIVTEYCSVAAVTNI